MNLRFRSICWGLFLLFLTGCKACTEQHNPRPDWERFRTEQEQANKPIPRLTEKGEIPAPPKADGGSEAGGEDLVAKKYQQFCTPCHGADGAADSATALAMVPVPRNLTDPRWQASVDDARIYKVIKEGGASVGLSATMAPWGAMLSDEEINGMVKLVRDFAAK